MQRATDRRKQGFTYVILFAAFLGQTPKVMYVKATSRQLLCRLADAFLPAIAHTGNPTYNDLAEEMMVPSSQAQLQPTAEIQPAGWFTTALLFGVPAFVFALLFHWLGPDLGRHGTSWWRIFHFLLVLPLAVMLVAALVAAGLDVGSLSWKCLRLRLRLSLPRRTVWLWAVALSGFMFGGNWPDLVAIAASWLALWEEKTRRTWVFAAVLAAVLVKRNIGIVQPTLQSVRFFDPSHFHHEFFSHFGPQDFMGVPLQGAWWILVYYAVVMFICNIGGEELWWRGYVLPRQELAFGKTAWVVHGIFWSGFHLFMQPTLWDTARMAVTGLALSFVAQRTRSTWPGIVGHSFGNLPFYLSLVHGVIAH